MWEGELIRGKKRTMRQSQEDKKGKRVTDKQRGSVK